MKIYDRFKKTKIIFRYNYLLLNKKNDVPYLDWYVGCLLDFLMKYVC